MEILKKYKTAIIIIIVLVAAFVAYTYLYPSGSSSDSLISKTDVNGLQSSGPSGQEFVTQLLTLNKLAFKTEIFNDPVFNSLQDFSQALIPQEAGRPNPFSPLDFGAIPTSISSTSPSAGTFAPNTISDSTSTKSVKK